MSKNQKTLIAGAGVVGLTAAIELAERGLEVEVIERHANQGGHACSWYAGGMLAPWCEGEATEEPVIRLGQKSIPWWEKHLLKSNSQISKRGSIVIAPPRDTSELNRFSKRTNNHEVINSKELALLEPDLDGRFQTGLFFKEEAHIEPRLALNALIKKLAAMNVNIRYDTELASLKHSGITIDARGFGARDTLTNLRGVKGEMLLLKSSDVNITRPIRLIHPRFPVYIVPRENGVYMIGATQIESEQRGAITARGMVDLLNAAYAIHPAFADAEILETGSDVRPAFPDNLPRLKWVDNTLYINGLFRHGFLLAPACAQMAADAVLDRQYIPEFMYD